MVKGKWLTAVLAVVMAVSFAGCSMVSVNEERNRAQVVAEVDGTIIDKGQYIDNIDSYLSIYSMTEEDMLAEKDNEVYKQGVIDALVDQELLFREAEKRGIVDFSEEHLAELEEQQREWAATIYESYRDGEQGQESSDPDAYARTQLRKYLEEQNITSFADYAKKVARDEAVQAVYDSIIEEVNVTEEDAKAYYDEQVAMQEPTIEQDPQSYEMYKAFGTVYVNPETARYVKNLLIKIPDEKTSEISALRESGEEEEADRILQEELAKIRDAADEAYQKLQDGGDFDALMEEIGEDSGMTAEPAKTYGYMVYDGSTEYAQEFTDAAMAIESVGGYTEPVATDYGYHIIKYESEGAGPVPFEMMKDDIITDRQEVKESEAVENYLNELKETADIKTYVNRV